MYMLQNGVNPLIIPKDPPTNVQMTPRNVRVAWSTYHIQDLREAVDQVKQDCPNQGFEPVEQILHLLLLLLIKLFLKVSMQVVEILASKSIKASASAVQCAVRRHLPSELKYIKRFGQR